MTTETDPTLTGTDWMLSLVSGVHGVQHVVVLTSDGLPRARTEHTSADDADRVAAACAGLVALGLGMSRTFGQSEAVRQILVEYDGGLLFVRTADDGSRLAVVTDTTIEPSEVAQQMQAQVQLIGERALASDATTA